MLETGECAAEEGVEKLAGNRETGSVATSWLLWVAYMLCYADLKVQSLIPKRLAAD